MDGSLDFPIHEWRYKQLLKPIGKKRPVLRRRPICPDALLWFYKKMTSSHFDNPPEVTCVALVLVFVFLPIGAKIEGLEMARLGSLFRCDAPLSIDMYPNE